MKTKAASLKIIKIKTTPFDAADYLDDNETIAAYLSAALTDPRIFPMPVSPAVKMQELVAELGQADKTLGH
jgi:DNA-binding phage protein